MDVSGETQSDTAVAPDWLTCLLEGWCGMSAFSIAELFLGKLDHPVKRGCWLLVVLPVVTLKLLVDGVCLLLDELFFPEAKNVLIEKPVFVVGPPRSGTTFLHRVLAEDHVRFVTSPAWEVLLVPSVLQKKFFRGLLSLDRKVGRPLVRGFRWVEKRLMSAFEDTHPGSLADPEEDYFYLSSICACTGWLLAFPAWKGIRRGMPGQEECSEDFRRRALVFYRHCLKKQVFVDGGNRTVLSKNASFSSWMDLLPDFFPDARFVVCMRDPAEAVPSMLSTAQASVRVAYATAGKNRLQECLLDEMKAHYGCLNRVIPEWKAGRAVVVRQSDLKENLVAVVRTCTENLSLDLSDSFWQSLNINAERSRAHRSTHSYDLADFGLSAEDLRDTFPQLEPTPFDDKH